MGICSCSCSFGEDLNEEKTLLYSSVMVVVEASVILRVLVAVAVVAVDVVVAVGL
jgi:hypothetical protein